jgi:hypothetical protein
MGHATFRILEQLPSGKRLHNYGKSPCSMGKSTISMAIFNSYFLMWNNVDMLPKWKSSGWWLTYPSEKYDFVSWDHDIHNIWNNKNHVPNHQPVIMFGPYHASFLVKRLLITLLPIG